MFSTIIFRLVRQALSIALLLISACLMVFVTQSLAQTDSTKPGACRILSDSLAAESAKIYQKWSRTRDTSDTVSLNRALNLARQSIQADSTYSAAYWHISYVLNAMSKRQEAISAAEKGMELDGKLTTAWLGRLYFLDGQREKALETFKKRILVNPASYEFYVDVRDYLGQCDFSPEEIKGVLSLYDPTKIEKPEVLERSAALYQSLHGYRDTTTVEMRIIRPGMDNRITVPSLFAFQRPNRLRIESRNAPEGMGAALFSDGTNLVSYNEMWKQYKQEDAPETLTTAVLQGQAAGPVEDSFVPKMLLSAEPLKELLEGVGKAEEVGREELDGVPVTIVELTKRAGSLPGSTGMLKQDALVGLRLSIGSRDFLIRQMAYELDMGKMVDEKMPQKQRAMMEGMKVSYSLRNTAIETNPEFSGQDFTFTLPEGAKLVEEFMPPETLEKLAVLFGKPAPAFALMDLEGREVKLADFAGKVVILDFWATWCPPCVKEIPEFVELYEADKDKGLVIVGISLDQGGIEVVKKFAAEHKVNYPLIMGDKKVDEAYGGIQSIPTTFIIDRKGNIVDGVVGGRPKSYFEKKISGFF
jgi:peroxiredoxin/tetratricopeptide (TPR) repeat protein